MDRIENLIRGLDPVRAERESADSATEIIAFPMDASRQESGFIMDSDSAPTGDVTGAGDDEDGAFSDDRPVVVPMRRRRVAAAVAGVAAAAAVAGAIVVGGALEPQDPMPAATTGPSPSSAPTEEATADPSSGPTGDPTPEPSGVPTGPPAAEGCRAQDVNVIMEQGSDFMSTTPLTTNPEYYPVVGCTDDWMAMELTDEGYTADPKDGGNAWFYIARRVNGQWLVDLDTYGTVLKWDTHAHPDGRTPQEVMDQRFIDAGIPVELRPELVGEGPSASELRKTHQLTDLGVVFETRGDWDVVPASQGVDLVNAEGTKVANLQHSNASGLGGACSEDPVPWEELGEVPVSVTGPGGIEVAARFTLRIFEGDPLVAAPSLIGADQPSSGESCMLYNAVTGSETGLLALTTTFMFSPYERGSAFEFGSMAEAEAYAASEEFAQLAEVADSITVTN